MPTCEPVVLVPAKVVSSTAKIIIGPYRRIEKHYYAALGFNLPSPIHPRWELHLLIDTENNIRGESGVAEILGFKAILKYECLKHILPSPVKFKVRGRIHLPPWGIPALLVEEVRQPPQDYLAVMLEYGLKGAEQLLQTVAGKLRIREV
jgi:hypothetical protein